MRTLAESVCIFEWLLFSLVFIPLIISVAGVIAFTITPALTGCYIDILFEHMYTEYAHLMDPYLPLIASPLAPYRERKLQPMAIREELEGLSPLAIDEVPLAAQLL